MNILHVTDMETKKGSQNWAGSVKCIQCNYVVGCPIGHTVTLKINPLNALKTTLSIYFDAIMKELTEVHTERSSVTGQEHPVNTDNKCFTGIEEFLFPGSFVCSTCLLSDIFTSFSSLKTSSLYFRTGVSIMGHNKAVAGSTSGIPNDIWYKNRAPVLHSWACLRLRGGGSLINVSTQTGRLELGDRKWNINWCVENVCFLWPTCENDYIFTFGGNKSVFNSGVGIHD